MSVNSRITDNFVLLADERRKRGMLLVDRLDVKSRAALIVEALDEQELAGEPLSFDRAKARANEWLEGIWR